MMVEIKGTRLYFVLVGATELILCITFVICLKIVLGNYSDVSGFEAYSLFYLYFALPGVFCILSGVASVPTNYVRASIVLHIISIVVSTVGAAISSVFWQMYKESDACENDTSSGQCICFKASYAISCADGEISRHLLALLTAANIFMIMTSFVGSILGCTKVCCDPLSEQTTLRSRRDTTTSHSEQTVVSAVNTPGIGFSVQLVHDTPSVCQSTTCLTSIELNTLKEPYDAKQPITNSVENSV